MLEDDRFKITITFKKDGKAKPVFFLEEASGEILPKKFIRIAQNLLPKAYREFKKEQLKENLHTNEDSSVEPSTELVPTTLTEEVPSA